MRQKYLLTLQECSYLHHQLFHKTYTPKIPLFYADIFIKKSERDSNNYLCQECFSGHQRAPEMHL
jgi:hypothetical protein